MTTTGRDVHICPGCDKTVKTGEHACLGKLRRASDWPKFTSPSPDRWAVPGYKALHDVLGRAFDQAAAGKGAERHAQGQPFDQQPMQDLIRLYGPGFALGQAAKKAQESQRLPRDRAVAELLGAINYLAGAVIAIEAGHTDHQP